MRVSEVWFFSLPRVIPLLNLSLQSGRNAVQSCTLSVEQVLGKHLYHDRQTRYID